MTEAEWLVANDPMPMLVSLRGMASNRKLLLFGVACCLDAWDLIQGMEQSEIGYGSLAVRLGEEVADGRATREEVLAAISDRVGMIDSGYSPESHLLHGLPGLADVDAYRGASRTARSVAIARSRQVRNAGVSARDEQGRPSPLSDAEGKVALIAAYGRQCDLLRDIFGNPFGPVMVNPGWNTSTVLSLARQMYDSRDFAVIPILADALQDAGCDSADILDHCRGPGLHVRGCWVVDRVLGKK